MAADDVKHATAEGTNAGGDEVEVTSSGDAGKAATKEADAQSIIADQVEKARAAMHAAQTKPKDD